MGPTWVLSAPDGPHVGPMNLAIRVMYSNAHSHASDNPVPAHTGAVYNSAAHYPLAKIGVASVITNADTYVMHTE